MFAAGRKAVASDAGEEGNAQTASDWLSIGKSFSTVGKNDDTTKAMQDSSESALQIYKHRHGQQHRKDKKSKKSHKEKKQRNDESTTVTSRESRHLSKHKKKIKDKKRRRSWSRSDSSDDNDETLRPSHRHRHRRRRRRNRSNSRSRSRSPSPGRTEENRIVKQIAKHVVARGQAAVDDEDKLFEYDCVGDRDNQFFGSTYAHDQPIYELATRRNLLTGSWISQTRPRYTSSKIPHKQEEDYNSNRYFSLQARKLERDARQKRLYLAYSEKRLGRAAAQDSMDLNNKSNHTATVVTSHPPEMVFIPLDPMLDDKELARDHAPGAHDDTNGVLLTDGQNVEQHLVVRSKMLNAAVAANPQDVNNWLDLIAFQEQTIRLQTKSGRMASALRASVVEKQAAILARALAVNPQSRELHHVKLNMSLQSQPRSGNDDFDLFQRQLESLLSEDLTNSELWLKLLQIRQQHFGSFSMQSMRDLYARILTVLRTESVNIAEKMASAQKPSNEMTDMGSVAAQEEEMSALLLDFHFLMCIFEKKAGYVERSIAQLQALLDFSVTKPIVAARNSSKVTHLDTLQKFASRWNEDDAVGIGDKQQNKSVASTEVLEQEPPQISAAEFQDYIQRTCVTTVDQLNPPRVLNTKEHKQRLLSASAAYQRRSIAIDKGKAADKIEDNSSSRPTDPASDESDAESRQEGKFIYSNLHGYRINVDEADDTREYERILSELRGTESGRARQTQLFEREQMKNAVFAATQSQVEDQRANYDSIDENDSFLQWLKREEELTQLQWAPLRSNNPLHQDLLEHQPDRATLTEEIQPFLFPVPVAHQWRLICELLQVCGVEWRGEYSWTTCKSLYADSPGDYELLVDPILSALNPQADHSKNQTLFLAPGDRKELLESALIYDIAVKNGVLRDPSKVAFVRRVFEQSLDVFHNRDEGFRSTLKCMWIGFEADVARASNAEEESQTYVGRLIQSLALKTTNGDTDFDVLFAYAKLELKLGNKRQVKRICENTLNSLGTPPPNNTLVARAFHRFVFLRTRLEMWHPTAEQETTRLQERLRLLRCLYILWNVWQPEQLHGKKKETLDAITKKHRKHTLDYLHERLLSDPSIGANIIARYRAEYDFAVRHCPESCNASNSPLCRSGCWAGYCLHNLTLAVYASHGFKAACNEYREALAKVEHQTCSNLAWMWTCFLEFMQQHQLSDSFPAVSPREWRLSIGEAVEKFPNNELFLRLFIDSETGNTISQVLRNYFLRVEKRWRRHYDSPELVEWLFALLCEVCRAERAATIKELSDTVQSSANKPSRPTCCLFHRWCMNGTAVTRIRQMFEGMVNQIRTKGNALCWRLYMRFEVALGKVDAAKKVLYRGIAACAWSKELYMDGLRMLRPYLSEEECQELLDFMEAKELNLRAEPQN